jgi:Ran GTPase-activating protein (RanGAP) involved in mRNA processing and transport
MQEESVMKLIASHWDDGEEVCLDSLNIAPVESTALFEFLSYTKNLHKLTMTKCVMEHLAFRGLTKSLMKENENCQLTELHLNDYDLTDEDVKCLSDALISDKCKLTKLDISYNGLKHDALQSRSPSLRSLGRKRRLWDNPLPEARNPG